jgi:hypothetical protein
LHPCYDSEKGFFFSTDKRGRIDEPVMNINHVPTESAINGGHVESDCGTVFNGSRNVRDAFTTSFPVSPSTNDAGGTV